MRPENLCIEHIAAAMKRSFEDVLALAENPRLGYAKPRMKPVGAKMRLITAPRREWKMPLKWLGLFIRGEFPLHTAAHGSVPNRSPFTAAERHLGVRNLLGRDVKNAFPTVTSDRFYLQMLALGFQSDIARLLTKLLLPDGYLPQGGPASNAAIDLFFYRTDCQIEQELAVLGARYTRFTDGLDGSFRRADRASQVAEIFERNLERIGLRVNLKKLAECGWQPVGAERVMCGVRTNSPKGTQLPREVIKRLVDDCDSLLRGARTVAPHTLTGLARKRRALQGSLNQGSQARIAPVRDLQRRLYQVDGLILVALRRVHIHCNRQWFTKGKDFDEAASLSEAWRFRKGTHISFAAA